LGIITIIRSLLLDLLLLLLLLLLGILTSAEAVETVCVLAVAGGSLLILSAKEIVEIDILCILRLAVLVLALLELVEVGFLDLGLVKFSEAIVRFFLFESVAATEEIFSTGQKVNVVVVGLFRFGLGVAGFDSLVFRGLKRDASLANYDLVVAF
jgi:hypothetical protein